MRVRATIEYVGTRWSGWQLQPGCETIQGEIERALAVAVRRPVRISAAGRTDAGVHASGQVVSFLLPDDTKLARLRRSLNALMDRSIAVVEIAPVRDAFDPRRDAVSRTYEYTIVNGRPPSPFLPDRAWHVHAPLDFDRLCRLAAMVPGERDFRAFRAADCESRSTKREVTRSEWTRHGPLLTYRVSANAFLKQMVRTLVGSMVDVARGRLDEAAFVRLLDGGEGCGRVEAGLTAPPDGLVLVRVDYPPEALRA